MAPQASYTVSSVSGASYTFTLNSTSGYYVSGNKGVHNSAAVCNVKINNPSKLNVLVDFIDYGENRYDYGLISNINKTLTLTNSSDSTNTFYNGYGKSSSSVQTVNYGPVNGYIYVKYRKDSSSNSGNDTLQFKVRFA